MRYSKGVSGNPSGRPVGAKNKVKSRIAEQIADFVEANLPTIQAEFDSLEAKDKLRFIASLLNYILPKQQSEKPEPEQDSRGMINMIVDDETFDLLRQLSEIPVTIDNTIPMSEYKRRLENGEIH